MKKSLLAAAIIAIVASGLSACDRDKQPSTLLAQQNDKTQSQGPTNNQNNGNNGSTDSQSNGSDDGGVSTDEDEDQGTY